MSDPELQLTWCVRQLPKTLRSVLESGNFPRVLVAGGFCRSVVSGEEPNDVDVWVPNVAAIGPLTCALGVQPKDEMTQEMMVKVVSTDNATTLRDFDPVIQIIRRWTFSSPEDCLRSFDFTIAKAAIWFGSSDPEGLAASDQKWHSLCDPRFYPDLAAKRLIYTSPQREEDEGGSMLRMLKFYNRGFQAPLSTIAAVIARAAKNIGVANSVQSRMAGHGSTFSEGEAAQLIESRLRVIDPADDPRDEGHLGTGSL